MVEQVFHREGKIAHAGLLERTRELIGIYKGNAEHMTVLMAA